jgi:6-phospho-beta-glucosidase
MSVKVTVIGGAGLRTPLLVDGLLEATELGVDEVALFDPDRRRLATVAGLCQAVRAARGGALRLGAPEQLEEAVAGASFIVLSIRAGGIAARARDERIVMDHGLVGQETTGAGGAAMALRTLPVLLGQARVLERHAASAWVVNFTNPAGLVAQALAALSGLRVVGICDTPGELFHRIGQALGDAAVECDYLGLNHLGWVRGVKGSTGAERLPALLADEAKLRSLYPADLFDPALLRELRLLPTEYLFFYYGRDRARRNQLAVDASRGEELERLNRESVASIEEALGTGRRALALERYREYLRRRSASYLQLEARAGSALGEVPADAEDPFAAPNGYHRVAVRVMAALAGARPGRLVVNAPNRGAIEELASDDVVEVPCRVDAAGIVPLAAGRLPDAVRGLVLSVKTYERQLVHAAVQGSRRLAQLALVHNPLVADWELAGRLLDALQAADPQGLGYLR